MRIGCAMLFGACALVATQPENAVRALVQGAFFGNARHDGGKRADLFTLRNTTTGMAVDVSTYGCTVTRLLVRDRAGVARDIVLGYASLADYEEHADPYFGSVIGRFANRIGNGARFTLDGEEYALAANNAPNGRACHLHGGTRGFDKKVFDAQVVHSKNAEPGVRLRYTSPHGEEGYPGTLDLTVTYWLLNSNALRIDYRARTDRATVVNVTNHTYFNLAGRDAPSSVLDHWVRLDADQYAETDSGLIPTGRLVDVAGTPFDLRKFRRIGEHVDSDALKVAGGYDHTYAIRAWQDDGALRHAATVKETQTSRIVLDVWTTEPAVQFYTGNFLNESLPASKANALAPDATRKYAYFKRSGFCLETQHFPDSPNKPQFPSVVLRPGDEFRSSTVYHFSVDGKA